MDKLNILSTPDLALPKLVTEVENRKPQANIPQTPAERNRIKKQIEIYVRQKQIVPPVPMSELKIVADDFLSYAELDPNYRDYVAVLLNNESWKDTLATIPYNRRLLLLPKCLRVEDKCPAPFDEFGLLCKNCGLCTIEELQREAERLGYAVLVAEGSAIVMAIIETGKIDAIVGVSCLSVLERAFPFMEAAAIPGLAIPLLQDDCIDTNVDIDWVWDIIHLTSADKTRRLDLDRLRAQVETWFTPESLNAILGEADTPTRRIAQRWLARAGKRWRPFLTVCAFQALQENPNADLPDDLKKIAVAVECFHKASLVHDDIEDEDETRYGEQALHEEYGIPIAVNIGDYLLGEGYRLIAGSSATAQQKAAMFAVAANGHHSLAEGQGAELYWMRHQEILSSLQVLDIFRKKTAPAFEVALALGATCSGDSTDFSTVLNAYSEALGIAYQIRDDLHDFSDGLDPSDLTAMRPSLLMALACEKAKGSDRELLRSVWQGKLSLQENYESIETILRDAAVRDRAQQLYDAYKEEAIRSLRHVENANLKGLLRRVIGKIFNDLKIEGWCLEFETRNAASGTLSAEAVT